MRINGHSVNSSGRLGASRTPSSGRRNCHYKRLERRSVVEGLYILTSASENGFPIGFVPSRERHRSPRVAFMSSTRISRQVHPFPARMAPELALEALARVPKKAVILDPMCGSGTVLKESVDGGRRAYGFDLDPLAVLISRVACSQIDGDKLISASVLAVKEARAVKKPMLPWMDSDVRTLEFVDFWFAEDQQSDLRRLAQVLYNKRGKLTDAMRVAMSRTIVTKDRGASLARDVSHSRPHRVRTENDYDVYTGFLKSVERIAAIVDNVSTGKASVSRRDARKLPQSLENKVDLVITSPPYLNAIDYMRGHRLSLVWLGYHLGDLREIRSTSIGSERGPDEPSPLVRQLASRHRGLLPRQQAMLDRYAVDVYSMMCELKRVLKPKGELLLVVGNSTLRNVFIQNSKIAERAAHLAGFELKEKRTRQLPASSRYLPPPSVGDSTLTKRMRSEVVLNFRVKRNV